ncbi:MAG: hypothetical protein K0R13_1813 [Propionibacteriaceae bacterium]|nr:hypothetical protein [Propionibacteriaceae bacterium]
MSGTATNSAATKTAGGSQAHFCATTKLLSRFTPLAITTTPMNHLINGSGSRPGTIAENCSGTPESLEQIDTSTTSSARRVDNPTDGLQDQLLRQARLGPLQVSVTPVAQCQK